MLMVDAPPRFLLREWRLFRQLSQEKLADCMETTKAVISLLESGRRRWNSDHIAKASKCLGCKPYQLFTTDPNLEAPIEDVWEQIPEDQREQARRILETFLRKAPDTDDSSS